MWSMLKFWAYAAAVWLFISFKVINTFFMNHYIFFSKLRLSLDIYSALIHWIYISYYYKFKNKITNLWIINFTLCLMNYFDVEILIKKKYVYTHTHTHV